MFISSHMQVYLLLQLASAVTGNVCLPRQTPELLQLTSGYTVWKSATGKPIQSLLAGICQLTSACCVVP